MNLTSAEDSAYKAIYNKIASSTTFSKGTCIKLMVKRGQIPQDIANQIWDKCSDNQIDAKLSQNQFFYLLRSVATVQSGYKYFEVQDIWKLQDLKIPKFPKPNEINQKKPLSPLKEENPLSNEKKENSNPSKHEETYHKPNVRLLNNLEATVDLNREDISAYHSAGKFSTPSFTSSNPSISLDLEGFKLHSDEILNEGLLEENKEFHLSSNVATNLSFLKSVNQMTLENKEIKRGFDLKKKNICRNIEISDYVLMKKGYLDNSYYIYRITSKFEEKNSTKLVERRYSDFEWLHTYLTNHPKYQGLLIPKMPEKHGIGKSFYNYLSSDAEFIKKRKNDLEIYLKEVLAHEILQMDEVVEKFLTLNSNEFNALKSQNDIYDQQTENSSFLKMPTPGNIKSFYQFYEHAQAYLYTKFNAVIKKKKPCGTDHLDSVIIGINQISEDLKKIYEFLKKLIDIQKDNLKEIDSLKENLNPDLNDPICFSLNQWVGFLTHCYAFGNENQKESQIVQDVEILLKKIEVVNIAQGNLSNYIDNLDYAINLYENKRTTLIRNHSLNEEGSELIQLQYKINSLQESIKIIEGNLTNELKIFQEKLKADSKEIFTKLVKEKKELLYNEIQALKAYK